MFQYPSEEDSYDYYPGSVRRRGDSNPPAPMERPVGSWDDAPQIRKIRGGGELELFTIGQLAQALNRRAGTLRSWETKGWLPKATFVTTGDTVNGNRRFYSREQVAGLIRIATQERLMDPQARKVNVIDTRFAARAADLWSTLNP